MKSYKITELDYHFLENSPIGERVRLIRNLLMNKVDETYFTATAISKRTGIAAQTITSIERGESKKPSFSVINSLAIDFGVSIEVFTDEYYINNGPIFTIGEREEYIDFSDFDDDSIVAIGDEEYLMSDFENENTHTWKPSRNLSFIILQTTVNGDQKLLYQHNKYMKELEMTEMLSKLIHLLEMSPQSITSKEWNELLKRSPLAEAHDIVSTDVQDLLNVSFSKGFD
ncbi:hypothetical protein CJ195_19100 [Bacillus sp. UMB0899]|nr:hypothetical protein CJ195_19100 [Bacillus sp. UMB0899]